MNRIVLRKSILASVLFAIGIVLPLLTGQIKEIGDSLLPMHLPVLLCGAICGWKYGALVGFLLPFTRSLIFSMPPIYPNAVWMAFELLTYGLTFGIFYSILKNRGIIGTYISLICAMLSGRVVWGIAKAILLGVAGKSFGISAFIAGAFIDSLAGIIIQIILIPVLLRIVERSGFYKI